jgi:hypothetical protein
MKRRITITMDANPQFDDDPVAIKRIAVNSARAFDEGDFKLFGKRLYALGISGLGANPCHVEIADIAEYEDSRE